MAVVPWNWAAALEDTRLRTTLLISLAGTYLSSDHRPDQLSGTPYMPEMS